MECMGGSNENNSKKRGIKLLVIAVSAIILAIGIMTEKICVQDENMKSNVVMENSFISEQNIVDLVVISLIKGDTELLLKCFLQNYGISSRILQP